MKKKIISIVLALAMVFGLCASAGYADECGVDGCAFADLAQQVVGSDGQPIGEWTHGHGVDALVAKSEDYDQNYIDSNLSGYLSSDGMNLDENFVVATVTLQEGDNATLKMYPSWGTCGYDMVKKVNDDSLYYSNAVDGIDDYVDEGEYCTITLSEDIEFVVLQAAPVIIFFNYEEAQQEAGTATLECTFYGEKKTVSIKPADYASGITLSDIKTLAGYAKDATKETPAYDWAWCYYADGNPVEFEEGTALDVAEDATIQVVLQQRTKYFKVEIDYGEGTLLEVPSLDAAYTTVVEPGKKYEGTYFFEVAKDDEPFSYVVAPTAPAGKVFTGWNVEYSLQGAPAWNAGVNRTFPLTGTYGDIKLTAQYSDSDLYVFAIPNGDKVLGDDYYIPGRYNEICGYTVNLAADSVNMASKVTELTTLDEIKAFNGVSLAEADFDKYSYYVIYSGEHIELEAVVANGYSIADDAMNNAKMKGQNNSWGTTYTTYEVEL
ncbi:MAG: hypothetical protein Q4E99_04930, partial [Bacillota bacterium]|nr:hypothetical protein [Bacillota bacterium]